MGFQQGLSGLNASSKNLDVIGHNIANANTVGFKGSRSEFAEIVANSLGASGGGGSSGIGVTVSTAQQFTQGNINITGNSLDVAINGDGFFIVDMPANTGVGYTRSGDFKLDSEGNLITKDGGNVRGITYDLTSSPPTPTGPGRLSLPVVSGMPAQTTTTLTISANLDADAVTTEPITTYGTSVNVYDSLGSAVPVNMYFQKSATANTWNIYVNPTLPIPAIPPAPNGTVTFSNTGAFVSSTVSALSVPTTSGAATPIAVTPDWSGLTQFADTFSITDVNQDGRAPGKLTGFAIESDGFVKARFSNGESLTAGQVQLARFRNNQGLNPIGANYWVESNESGNPTIGNPASNSLGALRSGALEDSNVDITAELVNMIVAQRSYQANAQTIKTQDQVLSTLVNLR